MTFDLEGFPASADRYQADQRIGSWTLFVQGVPSASRLGSEIDADERIAARPSP